MPQLFILTGVIVIWQSASVSLPSLHLTHGIENDLLIPLNFIAGQRCITGGVAKLVTLKSGVRDPGTGLQPSTAWESF